MLLQFSIGVIESIIKMKNTYEKMIRRLSMLRKYKNLEYNGRGKADPQKDAAALENLRINSTSIALEMQKLVREVI